MRGCGDIQNMLQFFIPDVRSVEGAWQCKGRGLAMCEGCGLALLCEHVQLCACVSISLLCR